MHVAKDVRDNPNEVPDEPKINRKTLLYIVSIVSIMLALFFMFYAYFAISNAQTFASMMGGSPTQTEAEVAASIVFIGYFFMVVSVILFFASIGLMFKLNFCRYIVIVICSYLIIIGFPLGIALFLCEKDVKALFGKGSED